MPLLSLDRINQWVPLDFMLKTDKMKLPLHEFSFVKATAPISFYQEKKCSILIIVAVGRRFFGAFLIKLLFVFHKMCYDR